MAQRLDRPLHDAEVVEDRHQAAEKDDHRQQLEGEEVAETRPAGFRTGKVEALVDQVAEQEA